MITTKQPYTFFKHTHLELKWDILDIIVQITMNIAHMPLSQIKHNTKSINSGKKRSATIITSTTTQSQKSDYHKTAMHLL